MVLPLIGWGAASLGTTAAGTALVSKVDALRKAFGQTAEQQGKAEFDDSYDRNTGKIERSLGEQIGDVIFQRDPEKIRKAAEDKYTKELKDTTPGIQLADLRDRLSGLGVESKIQDIGKNETNAELEQRILSRTRGVEKLEELSRLQRYTEGGADLSGYNLNNIAGINAEIDRLNTKKRKQDLINSPEYQDRKASEKERLRQYYADRADARADRKADREMQMLNAAQDRELKRFELEQGNSSRRADLFKALFGLGTAFMI